MRIDPNAAIGVFDSGVGGLTVLTALRERLPAEDLIYLGDTARLPYGTKSAASVTRYAEQAARLLVARDIKLLVVACNTASSVALPVLREAYAPLPVIGVVEPGAAAGCAASKTGRIAVIATESTVRGGAYPEAIRRIRPDAEVTSAACPLLVTLAEEGWTDGTLVEQIIARYLDPLLDGAVRADCLVLGCTHFPVLAAAIANVAGRSTRLVDSAATTAAAVAAELDGTGMLHAGAAGGRTQFVATDGPERFARVGSVFFGHSLSAAEVELVDL